MNITVIGLGLIGGSMALDLKSKGHTIIGVDKNQDHIDQAKELDLIDEVSSLDESMVKSDVIILAIPINGIKRILPDILDSIQYKTTVIDAGSTKASICNIVKDHPKRGQFVAAHPLAGTEFSGPQAALTGLFAGKSNIICEEHKSSESSLEKAIEIFNLLGMISMFMNPEDHDKHMAYVSHLSHISSFMLGQTVLEIEKDEKQIFNLASTGFESTVRLAKSSADTWVPIFENNKDNISDALKQYIEFLSEFKEAVDNNDNDKMHDMIQNANNIRRILLGMKLNIMKLS